jgi:hypothetical protein
MHLKRSRRKELNNIERNKELMEKHYKIVKDLSDEIIRNVKEKYDL